jgi:competence protein ComEA
VKTLLLALACCLALAGCTGPREKTPEQIKQETADATAKLKTNTKAMVEGVREGLKRSGPVDLNSASKDDLTALPGITVERADAIIAARPYQTTTELVSRRILTQRQFDLLRDKIQVKQ